jgi:hypothetical protein
LFEVPLMACCTEVGLLEPRGGLRITAHRFRHTVGTELAEGGARLHTIMKMLGHTSIGMTLVYAHLTDATVREDYLRVLGPGAQLAGPLAATLRAGTMPPDSIEWLKANFFRTELELGTLLAAAAGGTMRMRSLPNLRQIRYHARLCPKIAGAEATRAHLGGRGP